MCLLVHRGREEGEAEGWSVARSYRLWFSVEFERIWKPLDSSRLGVTSDLYLGKTPKCPVQREGWWVGRVSKAGACCCDLGGI